MFNYCELCLAIAYYIYLMVNIAKYLHIFNLLAYFNGFLNWGECVSMLRTSLAYLSLSLPS